MDTVSKRERSRIMGRIRSKDTGPEVAVRRIVWGLGYRYRLHVKGLPGSPDLVFRRLGKVILVHGCFWHMHECGRCRVPKSRVAFWRNKLERNRARDARTARALRRAGWQVLTVWECQVKSEKLIDRIRSFLERQGPWNGFLRGG